MNVLYELARSTNGSNELGKKNNNNNFVNVEKWQVRRDSLGVVQLKKTRLVVELVS